MIVVYLIANQVNGKSYVGYDTHGPYRRCRNHLMDSKKKNPKSAIARAIRKYGKENFVCAALEVNLASIEEAKNLERRWIAKLGSLCPGGYNFTLGGDGGYRGGLPHPAKGRHFHTEQTKKLLSWLKRGRRNPMYGLKGALCHNFGLVRSPETLAKIRAARAEQVLPPKKPFTAKEKRKISRTLRNYYSVPENRLKTSEATRRAMARPDVRAKMLSAEELSLKTKRGWVDPVIRRRRMRGLSKYWSIWRKNNPPKIVEKFGSASTWIKKNRDRHLVSSRKGGLIGGHSRWHVNRGIRDLRCSLCR